MTIAHDRQLPSGGDPDVTPGQPAANQIEEAGKG